MKPTMTSKLNPKMQKKMLYRKKKHCKALLINISIITITIILYVDCGYSHIIFPVERT